MSVVIPVVKMLVYCLQQIPATGVKTIKAELMSSLTERNKFTTENEIHLVSTFIDPRFKTSCFGDDQQIEKAKAGIKTASVNLSPPLPSSTAISRSTPVENVANSSSAATNAELEPPTKKYRNMRDSWERCLGGDAADDVGSSRTMISTSSNIEIEMATYLVEPRLDREGDPIIWWSINKARFPLLAGVAKKYFSAPPTSMYSERLFSTAGMFVQISAAGCCQKMLNVCCLSNIICQLSTSKFEYAMLLCYAMPTFALLKLKT